MLLKNNAIPYPPGWRIWVPNKLHKPFWWEKAEMHVSLPCACNRARLLFTFWRDCIRAIKDRQDPSCDQPGKPPPAENLSNAVHRLVRVPTGPRLQRDHVECLVSRRLPGHVHPYELGYISGLHNFRHGLHAGDARAALPPRLFVLLLRA